MDHPQSEPLPCLKSCHPRSRWSAFCVQSFSPSYPITSSQHRSSTVLSLVRLSISCLAYKTMSSSSVVPSSAQPPAESLQQPIFPEEVWSRVFNNVQALDNLGDMVWLWMDARHVSRLFKDLIENLFKLKYLPLAQIRVLASKPT